MRVDCDLQELCDRSADVIENFARIEPRAWDERTLALELCAEVGSLAHAVLDMEGYKRRVADADFRGPWYGRFPCDVVTELLIPYPFVIEHKLSYALEKAGQEEPEEVLERAKALRKRALGTPPKHAGK